MLIDITARELDAFYAADSNFSAMRHGRPRTTDNECDKLSTVFRALTKRIEKAQKEAAAGVAVKEVG
jgi:hypothetical protein